jgi:hypothetical protein
VLTSRPRIATAFGYAPRISLKLHRSHTFTSKNFSVYDTFLIFFSKKYFCKIRKNGLIFFCEFSYTLYNPVGKWEKRKGTVKNGNAD